MIPAGKIPDDKDRRILHCIRHGMTYKEIAYEMRSAEQTVKNRVLAMRKYYNCVSTPQLIAHLVVEGVIN